MAVIEVKPIETPFLHAVPGPNGVKSPHAITTHLNGWKDILSFVNKDPAFIASFSDMYPRLILHRNVKKLMQSVIAHTKAEGQMVLLYPSRKAAEACVQYVTRPNRPDTKETLSRDELKIRVFISGIALFGVFFPAPKAPHVIPFWQFAGIGISSRAAEEALKHIDEIKEVSSDDEIPVLEDSTAVALKQRIADLMNRAPIEQRPDVEANDVYLFQTGMSAIYNVHNYLIKWRNNSGSKSIQFGVPFHQTSSIFAWWGPGLKFIPMVTDLDDLEAYLKTEAAADRPVQALWTEMPMNPLLMCPDLQRLRKLADEYRFVLIVDDTIGSFCNIDVLGVSDIVLTSLTKSFNGYADAMGGSAVLNKKSPLYPELKAVFEENFENLFYNGDMETMLANSTDYMERSAILNENAERLVDYLQTVVADPKSSITNVMYPKTSSTRKHYDSVKRPTTADFTPGYGCLFSIDFENLEQTQAFYHNLHFHQGPHLGAHRTLGFAYVKAAYNDKLPEGNAWGMYETQLRFSVGLESFDTLLATVQHALRYSDAVKANTKAPA